MVINKAKYMYPVFALIAMKNIHANFWFSTLKNHYKQYEYAKFAGTSSFFF